MRFCLKENFGNWPVTLILGFNARKYINQSIKSDEQKNKIKQWDGCGSVGRDVDL